MATEFASDDSPSDIPAAGPATALPQSDISDFVTLRQESQEDDGEHLNILSEDNQFEVPLVAVGNSETDIDGLEDKKEVEGEFAVRLAISAG